MADSGNSAQQQSPDVERLLQAQREAMQARVRQRFAASNRGPRSRIVANRAAAMKRRNESSQGYLSAAAQTVRSAAPTSNGLGVVDEHTADAPKAGSSGPPATATPELADEVTLPVEGHQSHRASLSATSWAPASSSVAINQEDPVEAKSDAIQAFVEGSLLQPPIVEISSDEEEVSEDDEQPTGAGSLPSAFGSHNSSDGSARISQISHHAGFNADLIACSRFEDGDSEPDPRKRVWTEWALKQTRWGVSPWQASARYREKRIEELEAAEASQHTSRIGLPSPAKDSRVQGQSEWDVGKTPSQQAGPEMTGATPSTQRGHVRMKGLVPSSLMEYELPPMQTCSQMQAGDVHASQDVDMPQALDDEDDDFAFDISQDDLATEDAPTEQSYGMSATAPPSNGTQQPSGVQLEVERKARREQFWKNVCELLPAVLLQDASTDTSPVARAYYRLLARLVYLFDNEANSPYRPEATHANLKLGLRGCSVQLETVFQLIPEAYSHTISEIIQQMPADLRAGSGWDTRQDWLSEALMELLIESTRELWTADAEFVKTSLAFQDTKQLEERLAQAENFEPPAVWAAEDYSLSEDKKRWSFLWNTSGTHWRLACITTGVGQNEGVVELINSSLNTGDIEVDVAPELRTLVRVIELANFPRFAGYTWTYVAPKSRRQQNDSDCGPITVENAMCRLQGQPLGLSLSGNSLRLRQLQRLVELAESSWDSADYDPMFDGHLDAVADIGIVEILEQGLDDADDGGEEGEMWLDNTDHNHTGGQDPLATLEDGDDEMSSNEPEIFKHLDTSDDIDIHFDGVTSFTRTSGRPSNRDGDNRFEDHAHRQHNAWDCTFGQDRITPRVRELPVGNQDYIISEYWSNALLRPMRTWYCLNGRSSTEALLQETYWKNQKRTTSMPTAEKALVAVLQSLNSIGGDYLFVQSGIDGGSTHPTWEAQLCERFPNINFRLTVLLAMNCELGATRQYFTVRNNALWGHFSINALAALTEYDGPTAGASYELTKHLSLRTLFRETNKWKGSIMSHERIGNIDPALADELSRGTEMDDTDQLNRRIATPRFLLLHRNKLRVPALDKECEVCKTTIPTRRWYRGTQPGSLQCGREECAEGPSEENSIVSDLIDDDAKGEAPAFLFKHLKGRKRISPWPLNSTWRALMPHILLIDGRWQCPVRGCPHTSKRKGAEVQHFKSYHWPKGRDRLVYMCTVCNAALGSNASLKRHTKSVHGVESQGRKKYTCPECKKTYSGRYILSRHRRNVHRKERGAFACPTCNKSCSSKWSLTQHQKTHDANREKFVCPHCKSPFFSNNSLTRHLGTIDCDGKFRKRKEREQDSESEDDLESDS